MPPWASLKYLKINYKKYILTSLYNMYNCSFEHVRSLNEFLGDLLLVIRGMDLYKMYHLNFLGSDVHFGSFVDGSETPADRRPRLEDKVRYNALLTEATEKGRQGHAEDALSLFREAYTIHQSEKLQKRIEKIEVLWKIFIGFSYVSKGGAGHLTFLKSPTLGFKHNNTNNNTIIIQ